MENNEISIQAVADALNISTATVRNWIKKEHFKKLDNGQIDKNSFELFVKNMARNNKLNSRANKSLKDNHNHEKHSETIIQKINNSHFHDTIGDDYQNGLSDSYKNKEGIYYTPKEIVVDMMELKGELSNKKFCDPACGSGNFILQAIDLGIKPENVYGFDIDPIAIMITKKRIYEKTGYRSENIIHCNFLEIAQDKYVNFFDYIYTNPPWGKKFSKDEKNDYSLIFKTGNSKDSSSLFFAAALHCLKEKGETGFLVQEAFFNISTFSSVRRMLLNNTILKIIDYGKAFEGLVTKAQAVMVRKETLTQNTHVVKCKTLKKNFLRSQTSFEENPKFIINFLSSKEDEKIIRHALSIPHVTLSDNAKWGLGIVTGNNKKFCLQKKEEGTIPIFKGVDISKDGLKEPSNWIFPNFDNFQQVAPIENYQADEKIIYKFISSNLCFFNDTKQRFLLNSANFIIPDEKIGLTCQQITDLLNSKFINWIFNNLFRTHKVLRGDLECLPLHYEYFKSNCIFCEKKYLDFIGIEEIKDGAYRIKS